MSQFSNYFEKDYIGPTEYIPYQDVSNLWPVYRDTTEKPEKSEKMESGSKAGKCLSRADNLLAENKFITEGDVFDIFDLKSKAGNPYRFYDGDYDIYRTQMQRVLDERRQKINSYRREVRLIEEALKEM